jgi:xanthine dehydrogenase YagR molybdenum-binding subunit
VTTVVQGTAIGAPLDRLEGPEKVTGAAKYAYEYAGHGEAVYAQVVQATVGAGRIRSVDASAALALPGVLAVLSHENAPRLGELDDAELRVLQEPDVAYRGQIVACVVADSYETARQAERLVRIEYDEEAPDVDLRDDRDDLFKPDKVNPDFPTDTAQGDFDAAFALADVSVDVTYRTPAFHNNAMEPHATMAVWHGDGVTLYDSNQGVPPVVDAVAKGFGLDPEKVRVIAPHIGGGFGSKGTPRPHVLVAVMCAKTVERPVKLAATRQQMFAFTGYRTPTIQRLRLGADREGRLVAIGHDVVEQTSKLAVFAEQTAVATRMMYAGENRRTSHRLARLNVPTPSWMRAPGETPGMYALESAMDELARELDLDPVELRIRNDPEVDPESGNRFSTRNLVACLREGAERFGWQGNVQQREGRWLIGTGVASSTYPARRRPAQCWARAEADGTYLFRIAAADVGTGARTVLVQIAADALEVPVERIRIEIGDSAFPPAGLAGGSMGTSSWGSAVVKAARQLRTGEIEVHVDTADDAEAEEPLAKHGYGAQFAEVRVDADTGEVRVSRLLGVFAVGRIVNAKTARSQFLGGMTMGLGMALLEESVIDQRFGDFVNHDLVGYHVPVHADVESIEAHWLDEVDPHVNPMGAKGIGEIGIVGTAAAIGNAVHSATGVRLRQLPLTPARVIATLRP